MTQFPMKANNIDTWLQIYLTIFSFMYSNLSTYLNLAMRVARPTASHELCDTLPASVIISALLVYLQGSCMRLVQFISLISCRWLAYTCKRRASRVSKPLLPAHSLYTFQTPPMPLCDCAWQIGSSISGFTVGDLGAARALQMQSVETPLLSSTLTQLWEDIWLDEDRQPWKAINLGEGKLRNQNGWIMARQPWSALYLAEGNLDSKSLALQVECWAQGQQLYPVKIISLRKQQQRNQTQLLCVEAVIISYHFYPPP